MKRAVFRQRYPPRLARAVARGMRQQCQVEASSSETGCCAVQGEEGAEVIEEDADETMDVLRRPH
eukprot:5926101-Pyramimonas_sp.AAC.1